MNVYEKCVSEIESFVLLEYHINDKIHSWLISKKIIKKSK